MAETIKIGGELESMATGKIVAAASAILDKLKNKTQELINQENTLGIQTNAKDVAILNAVVASLQQLIDAATITGGRVANATEVFVAAIAGLNSNNIQAALGELNTRTTFPMVKPNPNTYVTNASEVGMNGKSLDEAVPEVKDKSSIDLSFSDENGNDVAQFSEGEFATKKFDSRTTPKTKNAVADLELADEQGNAVAQFSGGEFATQKFDSRMTPKTKNAAVDLELSDEQGNAVVQFAEGGLRTRDFDSTKTPQEANAIPDFEITDKQGNAIVQFINGHIKTKNFDSENIEPTPSPAPTPTPTPSTGFNLIKIY